MEARVSQSLQLSSWINSDKVVRKSSGSLCFSEKWNEKRRNRIVVSCHLQPRKAARSDKRVELKVSCSSHNVQASVLESGCLSASIDEIETLKNKAEEVEEYLDGRCVYLVGMMGSGKTTVGRILAETLGYSFFDCDRLIEQAVGGTTVAEIFKLRGENFFRNNETEVLHKLSLMHRLVVSTGGGAVVRPINWRHMHKGISVWLDVPLEALAKRITAEGTKSRPLLHEESGDIYDKTLKRLTTLMETRGDNYANASARVSLENIAVKREKDVCHITPTEIALEVLIQIENFLKHQESVVVL
ncbi:shikimate kinase, chloroplastic [Lycium barbarum]|uniref:shikimate kinase, chloroplastic n=1 Tax=Lycium ferocissimum TaxID=112874 RepID=UPI002815D5BF|nr:shikimate kinase, chloroplastic [Lycium ferocissimum]XP_059308013.1 shikimate kinase, chloroplastic [Lycium ferocissimum]XP_059308014.1 shikimate kinase, chloroplastic [Lycium ferocissimum]XP_059308016.1 shikimate kinase, chloroplastic [Lycium ferocissimum]XP_060184934.1 shikimate kinase, chloroplastic [Lycium barbarum]XP_060184935.1 shikimate kinase, chloroplastic [Lycium barbarum]XP_060184936.1 shikimate kinase, chloroplastic [Lycium barbarum]XP_060184937.1 shikimate kinase, chloroplast